VFLTEALRYFGGAASRCLIDNTHVIVAAGTGETMIPAPEMAAFVERFGFVFKAHRVGHANRSARVQAPFHRIQSAFLAGSQFSDWHELNRRARETAEKWNGSVNRVPKYRQVKLKVAALGCQIGGVKLRKSLKKRCSNGLQSRLRRFDSDPSLQSREQPERVLFTLTSLKTG